MREKARSVKTVGTQLGINRHLKMIKILFFLACSWFVDAQLLVAPRVEYTEDSVPTPYEFSYTAPADGGSSSHQQSGDGYGRVTGSYSLEDEDGRQRIVNYVADEDGFRAAISTNEPGTASQNPADVTIDSSADPGPGPDDSPFIPVRAEPVPVAPVVPVALPPPPPVRVPVRRQPVFPVRPALVPVQPPLVRVQPSLVPVQPSLVPVQPQFIAPRRFIVPQTLFPRPTSFFPFDSSRYADAPALIPVGGPRVVADRPALIPFSDPRIIRDPFFDRLDREFVI